MSTTVIIPGEYAGTDTTVNVEAPLAGGIILTVAVTSEGVVLDRWNPADHDGPTHTAASTFEELAEAMAGKGSR